RDLEYNPGGHYVAAENISKHCQGIQALLDPGATTVSNTNQWKTIGGRKLLGLDDFFPINLRQGTTENREVLGKDRHVTAVNRAITCHHAVTRRLFGSDAKVRGSVCAQLIKFHEGILIQ